MEAFVNNPNIKAISIAMDKRDCYVVQIILGKHYKRTRTVVALHHYHSNINQILSPRTQDIG